MESSEKGDEFGKESSLSKSSPSGRLSPKTEIRGLASKLAAQEVQKTRPDQWGLLTPLSEKALKRALGTSIVLHHVEHVLGRTVADVNCVFESPAVSGRHCSITRRYVTSDGRIKVSGSEHATGDALATFVRDFSSNGTFINNEKLKKNGPEVRIRHGDILSLVAMPELENAFAYLFQEVAQEAAFMGKRKGSSSEFAADESPSVGGGKRIRAGRNGEGMVPAGEGPVSLDDVRRLQKSNEELRQQLEDSVLNMEKLRGEFRAAEALHLVEVKDVRTSVTEMHAKQLEEISVELVSKSKDLEESSGLCVQHEATIEDLNHRLASAAQSRSDTEDTIKSLNAAVGELKNRLEDEFSERQKERTEWNTNLEMSVEKARAEAAEELKRHTETSARLQKQQQDLIVGLQEADKEKLRLVDSIRTKLETERQAVIKAEEKGRRLGSQLQEERLSVESVSKKNSELETELRQVSEELEKEKENSMSAGAKVSKLESAMETAFTDLALEKQRLQGARERIVLRETQLRAFYSTAAQVEALQQKQQDQLKVMLRTLEDSDGEGEYPHSRRNSNFMAHTDLGNEARILVSLSCKQTPPPNGKEVGRSGDACGPRRGIQFGTDVKGEKLTSSLEADRRLSNEMDWVVGDTQQEDEEPLMMSKMLLRPGKSAGAIDCNEGAQAGAIQNSKRKAASLASHQEETQVIQDPDPGATLLIGDTLQITGSSEAETPMETHVASNSRSSDQRRKSGVGMDVDGTPAADLRGGDGRGQDGGGPTEDQSTQLEVDVDGEGTTRNDETQQEVGGIAGLDVRIGGVENAPAKEAREENRDHATRTICTEDLLTSEVAGSWVLGTQASVQSGEDVASLWNLGNKVNGATKGPSQQLEQRNANEGTLCTEDLLASEVAGSWALGTPASVHADNESLSSDEMNNPGPDDGGSQVATTSRPAQGRRFQGNARNVLLEDVMQFADPVNSQNSLSPATTNHARNDREPSNDTHGGAETRSGGLRGSLRVARQQRSDNSAASIGEENADGDDDSTTDGGDDIDETEGPLVERDASEPLNHSPSMSSWQLRSFCRQSSKESNAALKRDDQTRQISKEFELDLCGDIFKTLF